MVKLSLARFTKTVGILFLLWFVYLIFDGHLFSSISHEDTLSGSAGVDWFLSPGRRDNFGSLFDKKKLLINDVKILKPQRKRRKKFEFYSNHTSWAESYCDGKFLMFNSRFAWLHGPLEIDPSRIAGARRGGEDLDSVIGQPEEVEFLTLKPGFFRLPCRTYSSALKKRRFVLGYKNHLNRYLEALEQVNSLPPSNTPSPAPFPANATLLLVTRYEYANLYHLMTDFYNAYLVCRFLKVKPKSVWVVFMDAHPKGSLDEVWSRLFAGVLWAKDLQEPVRVNSVIWSTMSYLGPLMQHGANWVPLLEDFRHFFLSAYGVGTAPPDACSALIIFRRDYKAHPRNPSGHVARKIRNEAELVDALRETFVASHQLSKVTGVQIDRLPMVDQLKLVAQSRILIGMHGAGLTHALFLPSGAAMVELFPKYWGTGNAHFKKMAYWRGLVYQRWVNKERSNEVDKHYTRVPPQVLISLVNKVLRKMHCSKLE